MTINRRRLMNWLLVVSLGFNLLVVGGITARILTRPDRVVPPNLSWIWNNLDEETRDILRPQLQEFGEVMGPMRGDIFRAQRRVNDLMTGEQMDKEAIAAAFDELRTASLAYQQKTHEQSIVVFELLTQDQRRQVLSFFNQRRDPMDMGRQDDEHGLRVPAPSSTP